MKPPVGTPPPSKPGPGTPPSKRYGIDRAIALMRSLPTEQNPELVAMVITSTLESLELSVTDIIEDARARQADLESRIGTIKAKNSALEKEIELGVDEIVKLEASLAETMAVKERLELAHNHQATKPGP
jgi:predicted  nucleic acid-binding Zn-ribbon protein